MTTRLIEARKRFDEAKFELAAAQEESLASVIVPVRTRQLDRVEVQEDGDVIVINSDAEEIMVEAGDGCQIKLTGDIGIVKIEAGDGSLVTLESKVGGANVKQGNGSSTTFFESPGTVNVTQGAGSETVNVSVPKESAFV